MKYKLNYAALKPFLMERFAGIDSGQKRFNARKLYQKLVSAFVLFGYKPTSGWIETDKTRNAVFQYILQGKTASNKRLYDYFSLYQNLGLARLNAEERVELFVPPAAVELTTDKIIKGNPKRAFENEHGPNALPERVWGYVAQYGVEYAAKLIEDETGMERSVMLPFLIAQQKRLDQPIPALAE